jgi:hypothetical protein
VIAGLKLYPGRVHNNENKGKKEPTKSKRIKGLRAAKIPFPFF